MVSLYYTLCEPVPEHVNGKIVKLIVIIIVQLIQACDFKSIQFVIVVFIFIFQFFFISFYLLFNCKNSIKTVKKI